MRGMGEVGPVRTKTEPLEPNARSHYCAENLEKVGNIVLRARP